MRRVLIALTLLLGLSTTATAKHHPTWLKDATVPEKENRTKVDVMPTTAVPM